MKLTFTQLSLLLNLIKERKINALLLYGSDEGMINWIIRRVQKMVGGECKTVAADQGWPELLQSSSLFGTPEVIVIAWDTQQKLRPQDQKLLTGGKFTNFPIFISPQLSSKHVICKTFAVEPLLGLLPCYNLTGAQLQSFANKYVAHYNKSFTSEATAYLAEYLQLDLAIVIGELEKIIYYTNTEQLIKLEDVKNSLGAIGAVEPDLLFVYIIEQKAPEYFQILDRLKEASIIDWWVLKSLARYFLHLYAIKTSKLNLPIEQRILTLTPPIFFKYQKIFLETVHKISLPQITKILSQLTQAEILMKENQLSGYQVLEKLFFSINA